MATRKRPLEAVAAAEQEQEQEEAPRSPRKRLRTTVLVMMWLRWRRATVEEMLRQILAQLAMSNDSNMMILTRTGSMETALLEMVAAHRSWMVSIPDMIRSIVQTEMQRRQAASVPNGVNESPREISEDFPETGGITRIKLRFVDVDRPEDILFTGYPVEWQNEKEAKVAIFEDDSQITQGGLSKLQIEILAVYDDFFTEQVEFNKQMFMYKGKELVLATVNLTNGVSSLGSFSFPESSHGKKLRLTARVKRQDLVARVEEAITEPFVVQVGRNKHNKKSHPPSKEEAVHCLERIAANGKHCRYLAGKNITTVKQFMRHYHIDKSGLQKLTGMKKGNWRTLIKHATESDPGVEIYSYRIEEENIELLFNDFYDFVGMMINESYVPVNNLDQSQQLKANIWKKVAYKKFDERESSGVLTSDYVMDTKNDRPVRAVPMNNDAGPSVQARTTLQYPTDMAAQHEFGDRRPLNVFSRSAVLSNNDAGPSNQVTLPFSQNGTPYYPPQGNIINDQGPLSAQPTIPPNNFSPVPQDGMITGCQGTTSLNHVLADISSGFSPFELDDFPDPAAYETYHGFTPANNAELPNSDNQPHGYEHNW